MVRVRKHEFEDQTVSAFSLTDGELRLGINCQYPDTGKQSKPLVVFTGVQDLHIDSEPDTDIKMLSLNGDIIHFEINDRHMLLIIIWHGYKAIRENTKSYKFLFDSLQIIEG